MHLKDIAEDWLRSFALAAFRGDVSEFVKTFLPNGWLRNALVFTWDTRSLEGHAKISAYLLNTLSSAHLSNFKLEDRPGLLPDRVLDDAGIGAGFTFETPDRHGRGYVFLLQDDASEEWRALTVYLAVEDIKGHEELGREAGVYGGHTIAWEEIHAARRAAIESDPHVVIMGGGQTGLQIAARFKQMNIPTLVVEKNKTIGDQWRERYPTLSLHTPRNHHAFLYQPYPRNWPTYTPRDKVADWLKQYAMSQDLVVWTSSYILPTPKYDPLVKKWTITVNRNGTHISFRPAHIIIAIGMFGAPRIPKVPGREQFQGTIVHASQYMGGQPFVGKRVIVVGAANTAADICQDLSFRGAQAVTMLQRSSTCVVSVHSVKVAMDQHYPEDLPYEVSDAKFYAMPMNLQRILARRKEAETWEMQRPLHEKLKRGGLKLNMGRDGSGQHFLVYERAGGYWIDVGLADMLASGRVKVKHGVEIERFDSAGVCFTDGTTLPVDAVIFATGYDDPRNKLKDLFRPEVIDSTSPLWGLDEEGEVSGCYRPSGYPGLWYGAGDFAMSRALSKQLALQIKALQLGMVRE